MDDVIGDSGVGVLDEDQAAAARQALSMDRSACRAHAPLYSRTVCAALFLINLAPIGGASPRQPERSGGTRARRHAG